MATITPNYNEIRAVERDLQWLRYFPVKHNEPVAKHRAEAALYSLGKAFKGDRLDGREGEVSQEVARQFKTGTVSRFPVIPLQQQLGRCAGQYLIAGTTTQGPELITHRISGDLLEYLRPRTVMQLGVQTYSNIKYGDLSLPRQSAVANVQFLNENEVATNTHVTFDQVTLTAHRLTVRGGYSMQLWQQSALDVERVVVADQLKGLAVGLNGAILTGDNVKAPKGILSQAGTNAFTFASTATRDELIDAEATVELNNVLPNASSAYVVSVATKKLWRKRPVVATFPQFLWTDDDKVNGKPALATNLLSDSSRVMFGNWDQCAVALWAGVETIVDKFTLASNFQVIVTSTFLVDVALLRANAFAVSSNAGI
jgi:hypothetical protein